MQPRSSRPTGAGAPRRRSLGALGVVCALALTPSAARPQARPTAPPSDTIETGPRPPLAAPLGAAPASPASIGDSLRLTIWREPDLSRSYWIDESGYVNLPKIGPVRAAAVPPAELKARIVAAYQTYLAHSAIDVTILHRVQVRGAVRLPGIYYVNETMSLGDALALAGGSTPEGEPNKAQLLRDGERVRGAVVAGAQIGRTALRSGDQIYVPERSWTSRNVGLLSTLIAASVTLAVAALRH